MNGWAADVRLFLSLSVEFVNFFIALIFFELIILLKIYPSPFANTFLAVGDHLNELSFGPSVPEW